MKIEDKSFIEQYKPLPIPTKYDLNDSWQNKAIFALAIIGEGSAADVAGRMAEFEDDEKVLLLEEHAEKALNELYEKGLLKGVIDGQVMRYNLSKIEEANEGRVDPELLD